MPFFNDFIDAGYVSVLRADSMRIGFARARFSSRMKSRSVSVAAPDSMSPCASLRYQR